MKVALFGKKIGENFRPYMIHLINTLKNSGAQLFVYEPFFHEIEGVCGTNITFSGTFSTTADIQGFDLFFVVGGDGTFLQAVTLVRDTNVPLVGINSGRLGFLSDIAKDEIESAVTDLIKGDYQLRELNLIEVEMNGNYFIDAPFALNELAVVKRDTSSMITVQAYLGDQFLNTYWADGLIIATPTGSTAYSLSVGGPIIHPASQNFVITPIAPHNLTVRPIVVPNNMEITLHIESRSNHYLASLDSRNEVVSNEVAIKVRKANFSIKVAGLKQKNFCCTLRNKLMWGADNRN